MTRVKICGITNIDDARAAVEAGADALGFILVPGSPRFIGGDIPALCELVRRVPPFVQCIGVCSDPVELSQYHLLFDAAQFYQAEPDQHRAWYGEFQLIFACSIRNENDLEVIRSRVEQLKTVNETSFIDALLLDTYHKDKLGGSGETFDWQLAVEAKKLTDRPIILAGGLTPENVADALEIVRPYAVDVSSGVEASPGVKDHAKVRAFVRAVRAWDLQQRSNEG